MLEVAGLSSPGSGQRVGERGRGDTTGAAVVLLTGI